MATYTLAHLKIGPEPVRLDEDLEDGLYAATVTRGKVLTAQTPTPPDDPLDWLPLRNGFASYRVAAHSPRLPVWVRAVPGQDEDSVIVRQRRPGRGQ